MASQYSTPNAADMERGDNQLAGQNERQPLLGSQRANGNGRFMTHQDREAAVQRCWRIGGYALVVALIGLLLYGVIDIFTGHPGGLGSPNHKHLKGICDDVEPISGYEFEERQRSLSKVLLDYKADAYIAEPGTSLLHLTNIHWSLSERPFFLVIQAKQDKTDQVLTKVTVVAPAFEATRARQQVIPGASVEIKTWQEAESAFTAVQEVLDQPWAGPDDDNNDDDNDDGHHHHAAEGQKPPKTRQIFLDPNMRQFLVEGLTRKLTRSGDSNASLQTAVPATTHVSMAPAAFSQLRERKTAHEIEILRCVAQATVRVIQTVQSEIQLGMREGEVQALVTRAYESTGLDYVHGASLVLFGADAALPHGTGNNTKLEKGMMVLIDSGARLHGYISDITRTFWVSGGKGKGKNKDDQALLEEQDKVWQLVKHAQQAALNATRPGVTPASVDKSARKVIHAEGYGQYFTHRLGHGIGLEGHESPYLNSGNTDVELKPGMTFTVEPGVYIEGKFGIRLEDMALVTESGYELLSGSLAESADKP